MFKTNYTMTDESYPYHEVAWSTFEKGTKYDTVSVRTTFDLEQSLLISDAYIDYEESTKVLPPVNIYADKIIQVGQVVMFLGNDYPIWINLGDD